MDKEYQIKLVAETANRLASDGNNSAASAMFSIAAAMSLNIEGVIANKLVDELKKQMYSPLGE